PVRGPVRALRAGIGRGAVRGFPVAFRGRGGAPASLDARRLAAVAVDSRATWATAAARTLEDARQPAPLAAGALFDGAVDRGLRRPAVATAGVAAAGARPGPMASAGECGGTPGVAAGGALAPHASAAPAGRLQCRTRARRGVTGAAGTERLACRRCH